MEERTPQPRSSERCGGPSVKEAMDTDFVKGKRKLRSRLSLHIRPKLSELLGKRGSGFTHSSRTCLL